MHVHVIIVAGGSGSRFGGSLPKQYCLLAGRPVLMHTVDRIRQALPTASISLVISASMESLWQDLCADHGFESPEIVHGGSTRSESVRNAVERLCVPVPDVVLVHDGARPLVPESVVRSVVAAMTDTDADGAIPSVAVTDSLRRTMPDGSSVAIDRSEFRAVQTPQAFRGPLLAEAYASSVGNFSDDASLMESCGYGRFVLTEGSPLNIKITNPADIAVAECLLK